jgi:hypothetical protein
MRWRLPIDTRISGDPFSSGVNSIWNRYMQRRFGAVLLLSALAAMPPNGWSDDSRKLSISPSSLSLITPESTEQLLVVSSGTSEDVTRQVVFTTTAPGIVSISPGGRVSPLADGTTEIQVEFGAQKATVRVDVTGMSAPPPVSFRQEVVPILTKAGCNSGGCHGKAEGQNGFKLSVFGYDATADHQALVMEGHGRRVFPTAPDRSLLLLKATAVSPHGGGKKLDRDSLWYRRLRRWIAEGMPSDAEKPDPVVGIDVEPAAVSLDALTSQQLRVTARDANGQARCVTVEAEYQSNQDAIAEVDREGLITATDRPGEAAILVRYLRHVAVCRVSRPRDSGRFARPPERNFVDRLVWDKLESLRIEPSRPADDATYLRRVYLDTIGTLPTPDEARQFLADSNPDKRQRLVDELLDRPEYADYWAQRWADLLTVDKDLVTPQGALAMTRWLRREFTRNAPYDDLVRSILTARGSTLAESPAAFFQVQSDPEKTARAVSQLFLGVRIECAQCHHHPFERWDQHDYFALSGFFTGIERKANPLGGMKIVATSGTDLNHPRTGTPVSTAGLGASPAELKNIEDRRLAFADWATSPENPWFARAIANRLWAHYLGRGLVEPIDDLRATNPACNEPLLEALAQHLIEVDYDLKAFTRTLLASEVYGLRADVTESNANDEQNASHAAWKPIPAEVLLDAISQATGVPEEFNGWPRGYRAIQVWDCKLPSHFLEVFGRPTRQTVCSCERGVEPSIAQALHLMNSPTTSRKIHDPAGRAAPLADSDLTPDEIADELFLATLSRFPSEGERQLMRQTFVESGNRREAAEDILWTLLNTKEFVFNH